MCCTLFKTCCCCYFWCVCVFSPIFFSLPSPNVPPLPILCLSPMFFSQSLQWRDWKRVWWRTLVTPLMKRKTTQLPKPQGQVTLGQFPLPPHPQAGHRAIAALFLPRLVLKHSHSHNLYHFGWHPKTGKHTQCVFFFFSDSHGTFTQTEPVLFHHSLPVHHSENSYCSSPCWLQIFLVDPNGHTWVLTLNNSVILVHTV